MDAGNEVGSRHGYQEPKFDTVFLRRQPRSLPIPGQVSHANLYRSCCRWYRDVYFMETHDCYILTATIDSI
jgi:hypothetical protein